MTIQPALTPEEWTSGELTWPTVALETTRGGALSVWNGKLGDEETQSVTVAESDRHALAALALHQQDFGFTREDVDDLREAAGDVSLVCADRCVGCDGSCSALVNRLNALAARIEALLPPEAP